MFPEITPAEWISMGSFSLGLVVLGSRFLKEPKPKHYLIGSIAVYCLIALVVVSALVLGERREIRRMRGSIVEVLGNQEMTVDRVLSELNGPNPKTFAVAFGELERGKQIQSRFRDMLFDGLPKGATEQPIALPIRFWFVSDTEATTR